MFASDNGILMTCGDGTFGTDISDNPNSYHLYQCNSPFFLSYIFIRLFISNQAVWVMEIGNPSLFQSSLSPY